MFFWSKIKQTRKLSWYLLFLQVWTGWAGKSEKCVNSRRFFSRARVWKMGLTLGQLISWFDPWSFPPDSLQLLSRDGSDGHGIIPSGRAGAATFSCPLKNAGAGALTNESVGPKLSSVCSMCPSVDSQRPACSEPDPKRQKSWVSEALYCLWQAYSQVLRQRCQVMKQTEIGHMQPMLC